MNNIFGIFTKDRSKAESLMSDITHKIGSSKVEKKYSKNELRVFFKDGTELIWFNPSGDGCGRRLRGAWVDKEVTDEYFNSVITPMLMTDMVIRF